MPAIHFIHSGSRVKRGFTLLELIITLSVMMILVGAAAPSFSKIIEENKIKRLATEIEWLLVQAKSEAVMRNEKLKVHFVRDDSAELTYQDDGKWILAVTPKAASVTDRASAKSAAIVMIDGKEHKKVSIKVTETYLNYSIDPVRATSSKKGSYCFFQDSTKKLKVIMSQISGRIRTCGITGSYYSYEKCN